MDKSNLYYIHNLWEGLEIKIPDILMISFNLFMIIICCLLWIIYFIMKINKKKNETVQVGPLCHLCILNNEKF